MHLVFHIVSQDKPAGSEFFLGGLEILGMLHPQPLVRVTASFNPNLPIIHLFSVP